MAFQTQAINTDTIFSEPVIVETSAVPEATQDDPEDLKAGEQSEGPKEFHARRGRVIVRERTLSPAYEENIISNSSELLAFGDRPNVDACVGVGRHRQEPYITTHPFADSDVQNISWLFTIGRLDSWTDKLMSFYTVNTYQPPPLLERIDVPIVRLGAALRVLQEESLAKVKYVMGIQSRNSPASYKLLVSHSRNAAAVDIFYEILNGNSIVFVGAVLKDAAIPVECPHGLPVVKFKRVESIKEAENAGNGVVGIIC